MLAIRSLTIRSLAHSLLAHSGMEADPVAFALSSFNLALNRGAAWARNTYVHPVCVGVGGSVSDPIVNATMYSGEFGNSCSGLVKVEQGCGTYQSGQKVPVRCYPLPWLLRRWDLPVDGQTLVKVDVESLECSLIPSWVPWLQNIQHKPTFYIAFHGGLSSKQCTKQQWGEVIRFSKLFRMVEPIKSGNETIDAVPVFSAGVRTATLRHR